MSLFDIIRRHAARPLRIALCALLASGLLAQASPTFVAQDATRSITTPQPVSPAAEPQASPAAMTPAPLPGQTLGQNAPSDAVRTTLSQYGTFVQHPKYGEVWSPTVTPPGWHPYEACHWVNTRQYGWYFDDKRPWGEIVHHYGRWTRDAQMGWIWVPDAEWSPGWVVWRTSPQWIGWAPQMPDEDITTTSADDFNNGGFWTFMDVAHFNEGCSGDQVLPAAQIPVVLQQTQFVTEIDYVGGIAIFVLPTYIVGPLVDIEVTFVPWTPAFYFQLLVDWNAVFNDFNVTVVTSFVDCTKPKTPPTLFTPPAPPVLPPPVQSPPMPPLPPITFTCANGGPPPCQTLPPPPPQKACPRGSHYDGLRCVANLTPFCPDGSVRDANGRCPQTPGPFLCANGLPPDPSTGSCRPATVQQNCPPPTVLRNGICVIDRPINICPDGSPRDRNGRCRQPPVVSCAPPNMMRAGACTPPNAPACPNGMPRDRAGQCPTMPAQTCMPPKTMIDGRCVDRVIARPACLPPRVMVGDVCTDRPIAQPACAPPNVMRGRQCVQPVIAQPLCQPPMTLRDGRCVGAPVRFEPPTVRNPPTGRGPARPFDPGIRHPTYGYGPAGNATTGIASRPPVMPVITRPPSTPMGGRGASGGMSGGGRFSGGMQMGGPARQPVVLGRGGGGQNMFNTGGSGGRSGSPQPTFHTMPSMSGRGGMQMR